MVIWIATATSGDASAGSGRKARLAYGWLCLRAGTSTIPATGGPVRRVLTSMMASAALTTSDEGARGHVCRATGPAVNPDIVAAKYIQSRNRRVGCWIAIGCITLGMDRDSSATGL